MRLRNDVNLELHPADQEWFSIAFSFLLPFFQRLGQGNLLGAALLSYCYLIDEIGILVDGSKIVKVPESGKFITCRSPVALI